MLIGLFCMSRIRLGTLSALLGLLTALPSPSWAERTVAPIATIAVRTGEHKDFDRIVFDAPKGTTYTLTHKENQVTLAFSRAARLLLAPFELGRAASLAAVSGADVAGPLVVRFTVDTKAQVRGFYSGTSIVVDVTGPRVSIAVPKVKAKSSKEPVAPAPAVVEQQAEKKMDASPSAPSLTVLPVKDTALPHSPDSVGPALAPQPADAAPVPSPAPVSDVDNGGELERVVKPIPSIVKPPLDAQTSAKLRAIAAETTPQPVAVLDPQVLTGAAVFTRGGFVTLVFDRRIAPEALAGLAQARVRLDPLLLPRQTGYRIAVPEGIEARVGREGTAWLLYLVRAGAFPGVSTELVAQPDFALGSRLVLASSNPPEPFFMTDPTVGDALLVVPIRDTGAFTLPRRYADFQIIPAAQGLVIKPFHERVLARVVPDGIEITAEGGLDLSPAQDTGLSQAGDSQKLKRIFDFSRWAGRETDSFIETRQKLLHTIIEVPKEQKVLARLDLVRFLFAHGMATEAEALIKTLSKELPELENQTDFLALRGATKILAGHTQDGLQDLSGDMLKDQPEIVLWKAYAAALNRDWEAAAEWFKVTIPYVETYPDPLRTRFMVMAIESVLATGRKQDAAGWLALFEKGNHAPWAEPAIHYLQGVLYSQTGRIEKAVDHWRMATKERDRLYKIRAEIALIDYGVASKSLAARQAADRFEGLRFAWRGDDLEFDILRRLGGFYVDAKEYRKGLATMAQALRLYPTSPETPKLRASMTKLFRDLYLTEISTSMTPLEALSLYSDFRFLIPEGEAGNDVRRNLAERLVAIDLLDPAGALLEDIIKNSAIAPERAKTATRLAAIRLLDKKADAALAVLDQSQADAASLPAEEQVQRQLLRARALSDKGQYDEALALVPTEQSHDGNLLRADMAMRARRWGDASKALLDLVGPAVAGKKLSDDRAGWLVTAATAMAQAADLAGLDRLASEYGPAMEGNSKADLFYVLTKPEKVAQMKDLTAAQAKLSEVDMFRSFLNAYRDGSPKDKK